MAAGSLARTSNTSESEAAGRPVPRPRRHRLARAALRESRRRGLPHRCDRGVRGGPPHTRRRPGRARRRARAPRGRDRLLYGQRGLQARAAAPAPPIRLVPAAATAIATFFATPADFRAWLAENHERTDELWVGFHKKATGKPSITWPEAVDEALCVGWIDGLRKSLGDESYMIRFTPRKPRSTWSAVNIARAEELVALGRMQPAGLRAFEARTDDNSAIYAYEQRRAPRP